MRFMSRFRTDRGEGTVVASEQGVCKIMLPCQGGQEPEPVECCAPSPLTEQVARRLEAYFRGEQPDFHDVPVDLRALSAFRSAVLKLIRAIPSGETRSYGEVAALAGAPGAARAVGGAMAANPVPIVIPCHRVVAGSGGLTGYSAPGGLSLKKELLLMEGLEFKGKHIMPKKQGY